jgi:hypothetical protein
MRTDSPRICDHRVDRGHIGFSPPHQELTQVAEFYTVLRLRFRHRREAHQMATGTRRPRTLRVWSGRRSSMCDEGSTPQARVARTRSSLTTKEAPVSRVSRSKRCLRHQPGVVDHHIDPPVGLHRCVDQVPNLVALGDVRGHGECPAATAAKLVGRAAASRSPLLARSSPASGRC